MSNGNHHKQQNLFGGQQRNHLRPRNTSGATSSSTFEYDRTQGGISTSTSDNFSRGAMPLFSANISSSSRREAQRAEGLYAPSRGPLSTCVTPSPPSSPSSSLANEKKRKALLDILDSALEILDEDVFDDGCCGEEDKDAEPFYY